MRISDWRSDVCSSDLRPARARSHDQADLRHDARRQHVALEHVGIAAERCDALLNASTAAVVEADDRRADEHRLFHHLAAFLGMTLPQRAAETGEILAEGIAEAALDRPLSVAHAVAGDFMVRPTPHHPTILH